ncbi:MAG: shikimate dehydrogenase [Salinisphaeraceae bacterium]|nr:shikimate dehydrogenase [Salinisphaeraceae bacterium]
MKSDLSPGAHSPDEYVVIGNPVAHSLSPRIHALFAEQTGCALRYSRLLAERDHFVATTRRFFDAGGCGANVTVPFKGEAARLMDSLTPRARAAGAVNTIKREADGRLSGDNTDGAGLLRDLTVNLGLQPAGQRLLLLGAGGAASGVVEALLQSGPSCLVVANRTAEKADDLAQRFAPVGMIRGTRFAQAAEHAPFDLVINATSAGLDGDRRSLPDLPLHLFASGALAYDMIYADTPTPFLSWAAEQGVAHRADGLGMLVEQAAEAFLIWRGTRPDTRPVLDALRPRELIA